MTDVVIRPMQRDDVLTAERVNAATFHDLDLRMRRAGSPEPALPSTERTAGWIAQTEHLLATDPGGCWVAEAGSEMLGFAISMVRETTWILATYVVRPGAQGQGVGKPLLDAALGHGRACLHGLLCSSSDPRAARRYRLAGFDLHPHMDLRGTVDRATIPPLEKVREGTPSDIDLMDSIDRATRGAGHGPDHPVMADRWPLLVSDTSTGSGYVYVDPAVGPQLLAASNRRTATRLLWGAIALCESEVRIEQVSAANQWALHVGMAARLDLTTTGYLAVRGVAPPAPYLPNGSFL